jgi:pimeloyl-ACP methyl ester carboxylesterase
MIQMCDLKIWTFLVFLTSTNVFSQEVSGPKPFGRMVDVGGWKLHLYCTGKSTGGPTVILENGSGDFSFDWILVQRQIEKFTQVVSYDRAGSAWSELGPSPRTMKQICYELFTALNNAQIKGPYILVGHSIGGLLVRTFAEEYPDHVFGVVLVEATSDDTQLLMNGKLVRVRETSKGRKLPSIKKSITISERKIPDSTRVMINTFLKSYPPKMEAPYDLLPDSIRSVRTWAKLKPEHYQADNDPYWGEEFDELFKYRVANKFSLGKKPLVILISTKDKSELGKEKVKQKIALKDMSKESKVIFDETSGHHIQIENPDLVVKSIQDILEKRPLTKND